MVGQRILAFFGSPISVVSRLQVIDRRRLNNELILQIRSWDHFSCCIKHKCPKLISILEIFHWLFYLPRVLFSHLFSRLAFSGCVDVGIKFTSLRFCRYPIYISYPAPPTCDSCLPHCFPYSKHCMHMCVCGTECMHSRVGIISYKSSTLSFEMGPLVGLSLLARRDWLLTDPRGFTFS